MLEAAQVMRDRSVSLLLVFESAPGKLKGVVTDRDLATRVCADDKRAAQTQVGDIATTEVVTCAADDDLREAEAKMQKFERSRLVALDPAGRAVGVVGLWDIFRYESHRRAVRTARSVLAREARDRRDAPAEPIKPTPATPEDEEAAMRQPTSIVGGNHVDTMKEFPS